MRLHRLHLRNFRGTAERTVAFAERGVTVVEGPNEAGKSTLAEALDLLLDYQAHSKARAVRRVQPVGRDVATEVAAELSCGPHRLTFSKRFQREPATTLVLHAPVREQLSGAEAHARMRAILAEHLDEALWRALRVCQDVPLDQADLTEQTSLAAALDAAAGARVGGEREAALLERVAEEFQRYHTPSGQPTKARRDLAGMEEAAAAEVAEAEAALRAVEEDVGRCADLSRALGDLAPRLAEARERTAMAERAWRDLERRQLHVERLAVEAQRAAEAHARAIDAQAERRGLRERRDQAARDSAEAAEALARQQPALAAADRELEDVTQRAAALHAAVEAARGVARERERALDAVRDADALAALDEHIARIEAAQADVAEAEAALAGPAVDDDALAAIERALAELHRAQAVAEADAPTVTLRRLAAVGVAVDGELVAELSARRVTHPTTLRIGDVAEVSVDPGRDAGQRGERVAQAEQALGGLLADYRVADVAAARAAHRRRADADAELERARRRLAGALGDDALAALRRQRERCAARLAAARDNAAPLPEDLDTARAEADAARTRVQQREDDAAAAGSALRDASARRDSLVAAAADLRVRAEAADQALSETSAALAASRAAADDDALTTALAAAESAANAAAAAHREAQERLTADDPDGAQAAFADASAVRDRMAKEQRSLEDDLRDTRTRLAVRGEEGLHDGLAAAERRRDEIARERARLECRAAGARLLYEELTRRRDDATRAYAAPLRDKLTALGRIVYGDDFDVELGADLRIARRTLAGQALPFAELSSGAREQLALLTRLAVAALVARDGGVPLLLDDALGSSDPARLERLGAAIRVGARDAQVIVLTCVPDRFRTVGDATVVRLH